MAVWPETLPAPMTGQAAYEPLVENVASTSMDSGAPKRRRRFTYVPEKFSGSIRLTAAQCAILKAFVEVELKDVGTFTWRDFRSGAVASYCFTARPKYQHVANSSMWDVSLELMKL